MTTTQDKIPKLRFNEFAEPWEEKRLKDIFTIKYGKDYKHLKSGDIPLLGSGGIMSYVDNYLYDKPSVLIGRKGSISKTQYITTPFWTVDTLFYTEIKKDSIPFFIFLISQNINWMKYNEATGVPSLNTSGINNIGVNIPTLPEQEKIAAFLSSVDERVCQLTKKKELLEKYKKGVMQKIFNQDIRFKDDSGNDFPDWQEKKLGEIATFSKGRGISKSDIDYSGQTECIRYGELYTHYNETIKEVFSRTNLSRNTLVMSKSNDVIIPASGETQVDIATAACVLKKDIALSGDINIIRSKYNGVFLSYYLNSKCKYAIASISQGVSVVHLYASQLKALNVEFPCLAEQQKIADFLTAIDDKIELAGRELEKAQNFKKGLLQQMFV